MSKPSVADRKWNQRCNGGGTLPDADAGMFRLFFERSTDAIWLFEPDAGVFVDCNPAAVRLMGCDSKEQLLQMKPEDLSPPFQPGGLSSHDKAAEVAAQVERDGSLNFEWLVRRLDGSLVAVEVLSTSISTRGRRLHVVISRDISERRRAAAALQESQQLLGSVTENISEAIYRSAPDHRLTFVNQAYLKMFGYRSLAELQEVPRVQLYADAAARERLLDMLTRSGAFSDQEVEYVRKDGGHFWGLASGRVICDPQTGQPAYHVGAITDITIRKRMEADLRQLNQTLERRIAERTAELSASEARFRTLVEHAPEAIVVFDGETGRFESCNANAARLFGLPRETLCRMRPADVSPARQPDGRDTAELARSMMQRALAGETPVFEWTHRHSSGRLIPSEVRLVKLPGDRPNLLRASITDNTERHRQGLIQRTLYEISEAAHTSGDLNSLYERIHSIIAGLMPAKNFYIALFDPGSELISFPYFVDEQSPWPQSFKLNTGLTGYVLRTGKPLLVDSALNARKKRVNDAVTFEGLEEISYVESGTPAAIWLGVPLSAQNQTFGVMAVQDYHEEAAYGEVEKQILAFVASQTGLAIERKRAEQALRESEQKFRALFEASSQGVMLHDEEKFLEVNPATLRIMGYTSAAELIGKHPRDTSPPTQPGGGSSAELARRYIEECMTKGSARFDWVSLTAQGTQIPVEVILTRIPMRGRPIIQAVIHDISERKKAEIELLRTLEREKELSALKSNFVSLVSHEFRTPLGIIMSSSEILEDYFDQLDPEERRQHLESIQKNTRRMAELMEEVLLLARFDAGKMEFKPKPIELAGFCRRIVDEVSAATHRRCPIQFAAGTMAEQACADERLLEHILLNLLNNAVKYSEAGQPVEFGVRQQGPDAVCTIRDHGIGIPEPDREWLFKAFHRGRNVGERPGTGLGLVVVQRCVERHGGRVEVSSEVGQGTTMTVWLPLFGEKPGKQLKKQGHSLGTDVI